MKRKTNPTNNRREKALATRRRMLRAAHELFCERGFAGTTMELIAEKAGVAVQTLYFTFHTKGAILEEALGAAITGLEHWDPRVEAAVNADARQAFREFHPWYPKFERAKTQWTALEAFVEAAQEIFERTAPLAIVMTAAAAYDPLVKAAEELAERRRVEGYAFVVEGLAKRGKLRRGLTARRATDVMLAILSAETYQELAVRRGWSKLELRRWFVDVLGQQLLGGRPSKKPSRG